MTVAAVGLANTVIPIRSHVYAALKSGDLSLEERRELVVHLAVHSGWPKASFLNQATTESGEQIQSEAWSRVGTAPAYHCEPGGDVSLG
jgi:4-carboxymuconolactone decarboxylase